MLLNKKSLFIAIFAFIAATFAFADLPDELIKRQVDKINTELEANKVTDAYNQVNGLLKTFSATDSFPGTVTYIAGQTYGKYLDYIEASKKYTLVDEVESNLKIFTGISNANLQSKVLKIKNKQAAEKEAKSEANQKAMMDSLQQTSESTVKAIQEQSEKNSELMQNIGETVALQGEKNSAMMESLAEENKKDREAQKEERAQTNKALESIAETNSSIGEWILWVLVALGVLGLLLFFIFFFMAKSSARQNAQFDATLKLVAGMQQANNQLLLGNVTDLSGMGTLKLAGSSSTWGQNALPAPEMNDEEKAELKKLAIECEDLGIKIDQVTKRKNNSKNVSELVYKLSMELGLNLNTSMAYFCAAMVYDSGFLSIPEEILSAETLTDEQRAELKKHVETTEHIAFVPEKYKKIFEDAAMYHHENTDGSGYPKGLKDEEIPQIARLIHVVESYNSLISRRNYKQIQDKDSAIEELKSKPNLYDKVVVEALDAIV